MADIPELLPCPRCGGHAFVTIDFEVWCNLDRCLKLPARECRAEAIAAWNTRAAPPAMDREAVEQVRAAASAMLPKNVCLTNPNWADGTIVPLETTLGELRALSAALSTLSADAIRQGEGLEQKAHEWRRREVQAIGAAISTRSWHAVEQAYNSLRNKMDAAGCWHAPAATPASHASDGGKA